MVSICRWRNKLLSKTLQTICKLIPSAGAQCCLAAVCGAGVPSSGRDAQHLRCYPRCLWPGGGSTSLNHPGEESASTLVTHCGCAARPAPPAPPPLPRRPLIHTFPFPLGRSEVGRGSGGRSTHPSGPGGRGPMNSGTQGSLAVGKVKIFSRHRGEVSSTGVLPKLTLELERCLAPPSGGPGGLRAPASGLAVGSKF